MDHLRITTANFQCLTAVNAARDDARAIETDLFKKPSGAKRGNQGSWGEETRDETGKNYL